MPTNGMSNAERRYNELAAKQIAEWMAKRPAPILKPPTCPYCGSVNIAHHALPLERGDKLVFCEDCGESWGK